MHLNPSTRLKLVKLMVSYMFIMYDISLLLIPKCSAFVNLFGFVFQNVTTFLLNCAIISFKYCLALCNFQGKCYHTLIFVILQYVTHHGVNDLISILIGAL